MYDPNKNEYVPFPANEGNLEPSAAESTHAAIETAKATAAKTGKRTSAVIGAKAKINPQNLAANAKLKQVKPLRYWFLIESAARKVGEFVVV